jgi:hypothetical protein
MGDSRPPPRSRLEYETPPVRPDQGPALGELAPVFLVLVGVFALPFLAAGIRALLDLLSGQ